MEQKKTEKILLIILVIVILLIILGIIFILFIKSDKKDNGAPGGDGYVPVLKGTFEEKLKQCLDENLEIDECGAIFNNPDALEACDKLTDKKDECFYRYAVGVIDPSACNQISDEKLKDQCDSKIGVYFAVEENEI